MKLKKHARYFYLAQAMVDAFVVILTWILAYAIRFHYLPNAQSHLEWIFARVAPVLAIATLWAFRREGLYREQRFNSRINEILAVLRGNTVAVLAFVLFLYFFADDRLSRLTVAIYWGIAIFSLTITRLSMRNFLRTLRKRGINLKHLVLVGNGPQFAQYLHTLKAYKDSGIRIKAWIGAPEMGREYKIDDFQGTVQEALEQLHPDGLVIGLSGKESDKLEDILKQNYDSLVDIQVLPDLTYSFIGHRIDEFGGIPVLSVNQPRLSNLDLFIKRLFDFIVSLIGLIFISPLLFLIALITKLTDPGPVFYGQERVGLDGQHFTMWKFRTMRLAANDEDKTVWGSKDNPRKTKFGSFLRSTSLDELPQLWNVLTGDMSLIGPRPERPYFVRQFKNEIPAYMLRHRMKAGITGWAQVNGWRGDTSIAKRIECDIYYIKHWSLLFDLKIIFLTFWKGLINKNAY